MSPASGSMLVNSFRRYLATRILVFRQNFRAAVRAPLDRRWRLGARLDRRDHVLQRVTRPNPFHARLSLLDCDIYFGAGTQPELVGEPLRQAEGEAVSPFGDFYLHGGSWIYNVYPTARRNKPLHPLGAAGDRGKTR